MPGARRQWIHLICLWLSIATVFTHAVLPVGSPLARTSGSAFSASTVEVSLGPSRRGSPDALKEQATLEADGAASEADTPVDSFAGTLSSAPGLIAQLRPSGGVLAAIPTSRLGPVPLGYRSRAPPSA